MKVGQDISIKSSHAYLIQAKLNCYTNQSDLQIQLCFVCLLIQFFFLPQRECVCASPRRRKVITSQFCVCLLFSFSLLHSFVRAYVFPHCSFFPVLSNLFVFRASHILRLLLRLFVLSTFPSVSARFCGSDQIRSGLQGKEKGRVKGFRAANCCRMALPCCLRICVGSTVRVSEKEKDKGKTDLSPISLSACLASPTPLCISGQVNTKLPKGKGEKKDVTLI